MSKKGWKAGAVLAAGAGITAVLAAKKRGNMEMDKMKKTSHGSRSDYRNTELGKHDKNSKGIYYTNGNYEAFARPEKPAGERGCPQKAKPGRRERRKALTGSGRDAILFPGRIQIKNRSRRRKLR